MKKMLLFLALCCGSSSIVWAAQNKELDITVTNNTSFDRNVETIEVAWEKVTALSNVSNNNIVVYSQGKKEIPSQVVKDESGKPQELLFQVQMKANESEEFVVKTGTPHNYTSKAYGRFVPERYDDYAWENDKIAFRVYGPALRATGELSGGVDVWVKKTTDLVIDKWYKGEDYHTDHGEGLDFYKVGPTLGAGGCGMYFDHKIYSPENYLTYKVLANGPIRTSVLLTYDCWLADSHIVKMQRVISLDAGSNLSKHHVSFDYSGKNLPVAIGINKIEGQGTLMLNEKRHYMIYNEPKNKEHGVISVGTLVPQKIETMEIADEHLVTVIRDKDFSYYTGASWSQNKEFSKESQWQKYMGQFQKELKTPLKVTIQ